MKSKIIKRILRTGLLSIVLLLFSACSILRPTPEARLQKLLKRYPQLEQNDTFSWQHLWRKPGVSWDSLISPRGFCYDTLKIERDRFTLSLFQPGAPGDPVWVGVDIPADSALISGRLIVPRVVHRSPDRLSELIKTLPWISLLLAALVLGYLLVLKQTRR